MDLISKSMSGNTAKGRVARQIATMNNIDLKKVAGLFNTRSLSFKNIEDAMDIARRDEREKYQYQANDS